MSPYRIINTIGSTDIEIVKTIEHLLCSLFINKIDNVLVETTGPEIPILDGSIQIFNKLLENQSLEIDNIAYEFSIPNHIQIGEYKIYPSSSLEIYCYLKDPKNNQKTILYWTEQSELIPAKTYGYIQDYEILQKMNLGNGSDISNTMILSINKKTSISYLPNYHKIIDFLGDIYTTNIPYITGKFYLHNPNHTNNNQVAKEIYSIFLKGVGNNG
ncbi:MAG: UDP-3-O-acyl-N-acetylglucosamine deacetylase [Candidatus Calescibacterium sp.]|nr:UDP-3-O-acyl-N-acetylglucosamine deacetylase [Candidatus Calescibacterium sp.]